MSETVESRFKLLLGKLNSVEEKVEQLDEADTSGTLLTREEAAGRIRISVRKLDDLEASGRLQAIRIGRRVLYHPKTIEAFIRTQAKGTEK
jgi:excisionase family DNA binding protein